MRTMKLTISATLLTLSFTGCSVPDGTARRKAQIRACGLQDDPFITADVDLHACSPEQTKKTTICHIPPGNPSNAHTLCVGNAAVPAHVENHQDTVGECVDEPPCDTGDVDAGAGDAGSGCGSDGGTGSGGEDGGVIL